MTSYQPKMGRFPRNRGLMSKALQLETTEAPFKLSGRYSNHEEQQEREGADQKKTSGLLIDIESSIAHHQKIQRSNSGHSELDTKISPRSDAVFLSPEEPTTPFYIPPGYQDNRQRRPSDNSVLSSIQEDDQSCVEPTQPSLNSTQQLRSGFFRTIKRQYPLLEGLGFTDTSADSGNGDSLASDEGSPDPSNDSSDTKAISHEDESPTFMTSMARSRLAELRKVDPGKVDVATGLQWIRLELHEMREQDKSLFMQLIKLHTSIKELRMELNCADNDSECSYDDIPDPTLMLWPRYNASRIPNFSSSDGAQFIRRKKHAELRRGFSLHQPHPTRLDSYFSAMSPVTDDRASYRSSASSVRSATAC